jgi:hypothetical protein
MSKIESLGGKGGRRVKPSVFFPLVPLHLPKIFAIM